MKKFLKLKKKAVSLIVTIGSVLMYAQVAYATSGGSTNSISSSKPATGTLNLINDVLSWILILAPVAIGLFIVYFFIRKGGADEQDKKEWDKRIKNGFIAIIGAETAVGLITLVVSYYK